MIDLHMHTYYSDGTESPETVLKLAEEKHLTCIAITDHNNCNCYSQLEKIDIKKYFSGNIICGIELNTKILGIPIEVLGYGVDYNKINKSTSSLYLSAEDRNRLEVQRLYDKCIENKVKLPKDFVEKFDGKMYASKYLHNTITLNENNKKLIDKDAWDNSNIFYRKYMSNPETIFYVDTNDVLPDFTTVRKIVKDAGGLLFIPHIFEYRDNAEKILQNILENYQIDGIECYYTTFTEEQNRRLLKLCEEKSFLISGGSDYHGSFKPNVEIGTGEGNLKIPDEIIENWKDKLIWR